MFVCFEENPCTDCGEDDPLVLEFDHVGEKRFSIAVGCYVADGETLLEEIARCEVYARTVTAAARRAVADI